jgi:regulation of enolase protein 1 (concanavalin A-like superfamily)
MSEFKYACPVCGQHIKCDSSQAGTVMDCPTCFQKITVPQAPADADQKLILTGSKAGEKKPPTTHFTASRPAVAPQKSFPVAALAIVLILLLAAGGAAFHFRGKFIHPAPLAGWASSDIGDVGTAGSWSNAGDSVTVAGDGGDIWWQADAFHYVYQEANGDVSLTVRVADQQNTDPWAKAGLMIRDSLDANASYAFVFVTPGNGVQFQQRNGAGNAAGPVAGRGGNVPCWIRLTRHGDTFAAETSNDGTAWESLSSTNIAMEHPVYAGLAVCSHNKGTSCRVVFDNLIVNRAAKKMPPANATANAAAAPVAPAKLAAPPANDTNWTFTPDAAAIPDLPVAGRIHGQDFIIERAGFQGGTLTLRQGARGTVEFGVTVNFEGAQAESLAGKMINVSTNADKAARVTLRWKESDQATKASFDNGYALRLEFGALTNNKLPGKIYLCAPDAEKSYLFGTFTANISKPKPKAAPKQ